MKNIKYLKKELTKNIKYATKELKIKYNELDDITKDIYAKCNKYNDNIDDTTYFKLDLISSYQHQIGYFECLRHNSQNILNILNMNDEQLEKYILENKEISDANEKMIKDLKNKILAKYEK